MLPPRCTRESAAISELYSAIQGEGTLVGVRQIFVRFLECHIACPYCDTPDQDPHQTLPRIERNAGYRDWEIISNPATRNQLLESILRLQTHPHLHRWVSFTGGEPLWYWPMIAALAPDLAAANLAIYLETDGLLADELEQVIDHIAWVAMDIKLHWRRHGFLDQAATLATLDIAQRAPNLILKIIIPAALRLDPFLEVIGLLAERTGGGHQHPLVLQPVTPYGPVTSTPSPEELLALHEATSRIYPCCRVVPQVHKLFGQR